MCQHIYASIFIRKAVEEKILEELFESITREKLDSLFLILKKQETIVNLEPSLEKSRLFLESDNLFHKTLFEFADKVAVWDEINKMQVTFSRVRVIANMRRKVLVENVYLNHCEMIKALESKDHEALMKAYNAHLDNGFDDIEEVEKEHKEYFI